MRKTDVRWRAQSVRHRCWSLYVAETDVSIRRRHHFCRSLQTMKRVVASCRIVTDSRALPVARFA